jgi:putative hydrolase of the HAD superfamily
MGGVTTILFDVGGVLLTNGWDRYQRAAAAENFGIDLEELNDRHRGLVFALETGRCGWDEYLEGVVFHVPRPFTPAEFTRWIEGRSEPHPTLAVAEELAERTDLRLATLNNESRHLNEVRIRRFGLGRIFPVFLSSCYLGAAKPSREIFQRALDLIQRDPDECLFVDDREQNVETAVELDLRCLHFRADEGPDALREGLRAAGVEWEE